MLKSNTVEQSVKPAIQTHLVDATFLSRELGFRWPVFLTQSAWSECVVWTINDSRRQCRQESTSRLTGVLRATIIAIQSVIETTPRPTKIDFCCWRVPRDGKSQRAQQVPLTLIAKYNEHGYELIVTMRGETI